MGFILLNYLKKLKFIKIINNRDLILKRNYKLEMLLVNWFKWNFFYLRYLF